MEEESTESETNQQEISERSQRFKRRLDYAEYSNDEDDAEPASIKRGKKDRKAKPGNMGPQRKNRTRFSEEEVADMWLFIIERLRDPKTNEVLKLRSGAQIWKQFKKENNSPRNELSFYVHFRRTMIPSLDATNFDMQTKTIIHYALEIPCTREFIRDLREGEKVEVVVNENHLITAYRKIKTGNFHEDDGWDTVWGDDVVGTKGETSGGRGSRQQAALAEDSFGGQNASQWNSAEKTPSDHFGSPMAGHGENPYQDDPDDSEAEKKVQKKRGAKRGPKPKPKVPKVKEMKVRKERKNRREKMHVVGLKPQMQEQAPMSSLGLMDNAEPDYDDAMRQTETSNSLLQLEQSWASVYTPLVDPFERDTHSPELGDFHM